MKEEPNPEGWVTRSRRTTPVEQARDCRRQAATRCGPGAISPDAFGAGPGIAVRRAPRGFSGRAGLGAGRAGGPAVVRRVPRPRFSAGARPVSARARTASAGGSSWRNSPHAAVGPLRGFLCGLHASGFRAPVGGPRARLPVWTSANSPPGGQRRCPGGGCAAGASTTMTPARSVSTFRRRAFAAGCIQPDDRTRCWPSGATYRNDRRLNCPANGPLQGPSFASPSPRCRAPSAAVRVQSLRRCVSVSVRQDQCGLRAAGVGRRRIVGAVATGGGGPMFRLLIGHF